METEEILKKSFELIVKHHDGVINWDTPTLKRFLRWAAYYRRLFVVWASVNKGAGRRIAAIGVAWRTEQYDSHLADLSFENTEFGNNLFIYQVVCHPDFRNTGVLFQLLSLALWRNPGVERAYWVSEHSPSKRTHKISIARLTAMLAKQTNSFKLRPFMGRKAWEAIRDRRFQTLKPVQ